MKTRRRVQSPEAKAMNEWERMRIRDTSVATASEPMMTNHPPRNLPSRSWSLGTRLERINFSVPDDFSSDTAL